MYALLVQPEAIYYNNDKKYEFKLHTIYELWVRMIDYQS